MVLKYWLPTGTCQTTTGRPVSVCRRLTKASQREKLGNVMLLRSHQWLPLVALYDAASWSATSLNTASQGVTPVGLPTMPALLMKAATLSAWAAALTVVLWSVDMSMPLDQLLTWMARSALGAYLSRSLR